MSANWMNRLSLDNLLSPDTMGSERALLTGNANASNKDVFSAKLQALLSHRQRMLDSQPPAGSGAALLGGPSERFTSDMAAINQGIPALQQAVAGKGLQFAAPPRIGTTQNQTQQRWADERAYDDMAAQQPQGRMRALGRNYGR